MFDMFMTAFSSACSLEALVANFIGVALGIVSLLAIAFALLLFGVVGTAVNSSYAYDYDPSFYEDDWDDWEHFQNDHEHEFDQLEEELMNELMMGDGYSA